MTEFKRDFFKADPVMNKIWMIIKGQHKIGDSTIRSLKKGLGIKEFCVLSRHYLVLSSHPKLIHLHYDVATQYDAVNQRAKIVIDTIGVYDDAMEYEVARLKGLHSGKPADIPNIN